MPRQKMTSASAPKAETKKYHELIRHFWRVRAYMQFFYIYGFYTREEIRCASPRTYDNEHKRLKGWMDDYYDFRTVEGNKVCFISFDSRSVRRNPLYRALKSKSFTEISIVLHFLILDILSDGEEHSTQEILRGCTERLDRAVRPFDFEENTLREKLREYERMGVISSRKKGRDVLLRLAETPDLTPLAPMLAFFSEAAPCGVVGSFIEDRLEAPCESFRMKHHYIIHTFDSDLMTTLLEAMHDCQEIRLVHAKRGGKDDAAENAENVMPLYIFRSAQDGRTSLLAWSRDKRSFVSCRLDHVSSVKPVALPRCDKEEKARLQEAIRQEFALRRRQYDETRPNRWGVSLNGRKPQHIEFTISVLPHEEHIRRRMYRECRGGRVEELEDGSRMRFSAELYDTYEILPWIRTFLGRIVDLQCENPAVLARLQDDLEEMAMMYKTNDAEGEGTDDAV